MSNETQIKKLTESWRFKETQKNCSVSHKEYLGQKQTHKQNKNKTREKTRFMGTPRYQRQKLTESYRFKETQKNLLSFIQRISWAETNKQTNKTKTKLMRKRALWALLDITSKNLQGIPLIQGYPPYSKDCITGLNIQAHLFNGRSFTIWL